MTRSVAIVGAGQIGYACWYCFADSGGEYSETGVQVLARSTPAWLPERWTCDFTKYEVGKSDIPDAEIVIDTIAYDAEDVERYDPDKVGRLIVVSSASVYCDDQGRTLDEAAKNGFPEFDRPITEDQATVAPGPETYSTRKVRMENKALELFGERAIILRPCAIYGPYSRHPREWWFVKRIMDGRNQIPLNNSGMSQFQTTNADLIGDFCVAAVENDLSGVFNIADSSGPTTREIGEAIACHMERNFEFIPVEGSPEGHVGQTPWSVPRQFLVDGSRAKRKGGLATIDYKVEAEDAVHWLRDLNPEDWRSAFPQLAAYPWDLFDYDAEDAFLARL